jgi:hypothetical protein
MRDMVLILAGKCQGPARGQFCVNGLPDADHLLDRDATRSEADARRVTARFLLAEREVPSKARTTAVTGPAKTRAQLDR